MMLQYIVQDPTLEVPESESSGARSFPNPTIGPVMVRSLFPLISVEVLDALGRVVLKQSGNGNHQAIFDLSDASTGVYFVRLQGAMESGQLTVVKE